MQHDSLLDADDHTFDALVLASPLPVLVDFGAEWCAPCRTLLPIVAGVAEDRKASLRVVSVDLDASPSVARRYGIRSAPTLLLFRGGELVARHVGTCSRERLLALLDSPAPAAHRGLGAAATR